MMSGEATPSQMGGLLMALRVRGETVEEITGAVSAMRAKMLRVTAPPTRSTSSAPAATAPARSTSRPAPRSSSPAPAYPSPSMAIAHCRRDPAPPTCWRRSASRSTSRPTRSADASRKPVSASCSHRRIIRDEERRSDPRRARHPHDLQSARAAVQSGRRQTADGRRVLKAMGAAARTGAEEPRRGVGLGRPWLRRPRRDHPHRPDLCRQHSRTAISARSKSRRKRRGCPRGNDASSRAAMPTPTGHCSVCSKASPALTAMSLSSMPPRPLWSPDRRKTSRKALQLVQSLSIAARRLTKLKRLVAVSNA